MEVVLTCSRYNKVKRKNILQLFFNLVEIKKKNLVEIRIKGAQGNRKIITEFLCAAYSPTRCCVPTFRLWLSQSRPKA